MHNYVGEGTIIAFIYRSGLTLSLKLFEAEKDGLNDSLISISSPVRGLRPFLAARRDSLKVPNPSILIRLPAATS